jgi:putative NADPH-quinone reductase
MLLAARQLQAVAAPGRIEVRDLYALYPDYLIDIAAEQTALAAAKLVVWQHPIHWYGMPPLLKLWLDDVLAFGWAYGPDGTAVRGKDLWLAATTGGPEDSYRPESYNRYFFDAFLPPYEQTPRLRALPRHRSCCTARTRRTTTISRVMPRPMRGGWPTIRAGPSSSWSKSASPARCRRTRARPTA